MQDHLFVPEVVGSTSAALLAPITWFTQVRAMAALEEESGVQMRKYTTKVAFNKCGQAKTVEFGHNRYSRAHFACMHQMGNHWKQTTINSHGVYPANVTIVGGQPLPHSSSGYVCSSCVCC